VGELIKAQTDPPAELGIEQVFPKRRVSDAALPNFLEQEMRAPASAKFAQGSSASPRRKRDARRSM